MRLGIILQMIKIQTRNPYRGVKRAAPSAALELVPGSRSTYVGVPPLVGGCIHG